MGIPSEIPVAITSGARLGPYEILSPLGAGGMGEVYRARDTRLDREVAIKVLPEALARDKERILRFEREAKVLASLNHPNIAAIHGFEDVEGKRFLVMELVEGATLADRLRDGALPVEDALTICRQIAEALEAAHERGIIHRDLKPGNVMLTADGRVKVLDFGLARTADVALSSTNTPASPDSPTATSPAIVHSPTIPGAIMGTAGYMSPEQARGKPVDKRSDIFSFGCVLYEMLAGTQPFHGETVADSLGATLHKELDLTQLPAHTPPEVRRVLRRCLAKDKHLRLHDIADVRLELELVDTESEADSSPTAVGSWKARALASFLLGAVVVSLAPRLLNRPVTPSPQPVTRFSLSGIGMPVDAFQGLALSPDGRRLAYRAIDEDGRERLRMRAFDSLETKTLAGSEGGWMPFFSPDGERVAFYSKGLLKMVSLSSGIAKTIALIDRGGYSGATRMPDDSIVYANSSEQLGRVRVSGGQVETLELNGLHKGHFVVSPWALPDGEALLCGVSDGSGFNIAVYELASRNLTILAENGFNPTYVASGHILFQQGTNDLMAVPFDARRRRVTGEPFPVVQDIGRRVSYQVRMFSAASDGTLAYIRKSTNLETGALVWIDRQGKSTPIVEVDKVVDMPRLSPDGRRIAFRAPAPNCDIWVHDIERGVTTRLTHEGDNHGIAWFGDGRRIAFARLGAPSQWGVFVAAADGTGEVDQLSPPAIPRGFVSSISPDGQFVLAGSSNDAGDDVYLVNTRDKTAKPLFHSRFTERSATFSPDGRYVAYVSDESGREDVYVQSFPALDAREQISTTGGAQPVWSRDGKELFFRLDRKMMVVDVTLQPGFSAGRPRVLFECELSPSSNSGLGAYDVSPDGQHFVMVRERSTVGGAEVNVVLNWFEELKALTPKKAK